MVHKPDQASRVKVISFQIKLGSRNFWKLRLCHMELFCTFLLIDFSCLGECDSALCFAVKLMKCFLDYFLGEFIL